MLLLQDVSVYRAHSVLTWLHRNQQQSTDVRQNVQIHYVRLWMRCLPHCLLLLHSSAGYLSLGICNLHAVLPVYFAVGFFVQCFIKKMTFCTEEKQKVK